MGGTSGRKRTRIVPSAGISGAAPGRPAEGDWVHPPGAAGGYQEFKKIEANPDLKAIHGLPDYRGTLVAAKNLAP